MRDYLAIPLTLLFLFLLSLVVKAQDASDYGRVAVAIQAAKQKPVAKPTVTEHITPACRCLDGAPCNCTDCACDPYVRLRVQAIRDGSWLVVAVGMDPPAGYLAHRCSSFQGSSEPRLIFAYGARGDLWKHRTEYLTPRREVTPFSPSTRTTFAPAFIQQTGFRSAGNC